MDTPLGLGKVALAYAAMGLEVVPLMGKRPAEVGGGGFYDATTNEDRIPTWWSRYPTANIGLRLPENWIVFDVNPRTGGRLDVLGHLPKTVVARTAVVGGMSISRCRTVLGRASLGRWTCQASS